MPAGYSSICKVCNSDHRVEIEHLYREQGMPSREIRQYLIEKYEEKINHSTIINHCREHFDVKAEALRQYNESQKGIKKVARKTLTDIRIIDQIIKENYRTYKAAKTWLDELLKDKFKTPPNSLILLVQNLEAETRQYMAQKQKLLGNDPESRKADAVQSLVDLLEMEDSDDEQPERK
jgi:DNA-binding transcriptional MerR regulator